MSVSIITCTNRKRFINNIFANYKRQAGVIKELIIILNKDDMDINLYRRRAKKYKNISVYQLSERISLGRCLNFAVKKARYPLIAKFDDDDYYSPYYLLEQVRALISKRSDVVGKYACLVYFDSNNKLVISFPREQHKFVSVVQGGTILFRRHIFNKVRFADCSLAEDVKFLRACRERGYKVYATSPYNYVYIRRKNKNSHTWKVKDRYYLTGSHSVAITKDYRPMAIRKF